MSWVDAEIQEDFTRARRKAFLSNLRALIDRQANDLLPFDEVRVRLNAHNRHYLGLRRVPLDLIVGSEGRYSDFDRQFLPKRDDIKPRWMNIYRAHYAAISLPPVELYKLDTIYFVKDGHHRISVARQQDQPDIEANIVELDVHVPLSSDLNLRDLLLVEEYNDFLEWTDLHQLRPDQYITFSEQGGYLELVKHINVHRYYLGLEQQHEISREAAVTDWYDNVYLPVIQVIRQQQVLRHFPGRTEADLYRWIMEHRWYMRERNQGADPGIEAAAGEYVAHFGRKSLAELTERFLRVASGLEKDDTDLLRYGDRS